MKEKLEQLKAKLSEELSAAVDGKKLEELRVSYLGKKGSITDLLKGMKALSNEEKKEFGQQVNALKQLAAQNIAKRAEELKQLEIQREIDYDAVDSKLEALRTRSDRFIREALSL